MSGKLNELPYMHGLWRTRRDPYPYKETWAEAPFGDRWRALKARLRHAVPHGPAPLLVGDAVPLPGFSDVPVAETGEKTWTA